MKLKAYLAEMGMTLTDFSKLLNVNICYMSRVMGGHLKPGKKLAQNIFDLTEGKVNLFFEKPKKPSKY